MLFTELRTAVASGVLSVLSSAVDTEQQGICVLF